MVLQVYLELDGAGRIMAAGGGGGPRLCVRARLALNAPARSAELTLNTTPSPADATLVLRTATELAPHQELLLWFAEDALAVLDMPFLTLRNIRGRRDYVCHECGAGFDEPNPLKTHLFLRCAPYDATRFWREVAARLRVTPVIMPSAPVTPTLAPAELEALATEWGRSRDGHLCLYCGKLYSRRYGLKIHIRTHTGYRPLRCRFCLRAFGDPSNLNKHVRLHAARAGDTAAPYPCAVCGRALARRRDLERHLRAHARPPLPSTTPTSSE